MFHHLVMGQLAAKWTPENLPGLQGWYRAEDLALANDDPISSFTDLSDNAKHFAQATSTKRPLYKTSGGPNSKHYAKFDGTDDEMSKTGISVTFGSFEAIAVARLHIDQTSQVFACFASGGDRYWAYIVSGRRMGIRTTSNSLEDAAAQFNTNQWYAFRWRYDGDRKLYLNGSLRASDTPAAPSTNTDEWWLGSRSGTGYAAIDLAELILLSTNLSSSDETLLESYLNERYNLSNV